MFPAFKPLPKVHDCTLLLTRKGRAPYILRCVAEIVVTGNDWKTIYSRGRCGAAMIFAGPDVVNTEARKNRARAELLARAPKVEL
jgi:hypothetical protein